MMYDSSSCTCDVSIPMKGLEVLVRARRPVSSALSSVSIPMKGLEVLVHLGLNTGYLPLLFQSL